MKGMGKSVAKCVVVGEIVKRRIVNLHQIAEISSIRWAFHQPCLQASSLWSCMAFMGCHCWLAFVPSSQSQDGPYFIQLSRDRLLHSGSIKLPGCVCCMTLLQP